MSSDKVPKNCIALPNTYCSIVQSDSHRINGFLRVNALEVKARIVGIHFEKAVGGFFGLVYQGG
jgi:hypothetical protein